MERSEDRIRGEEKAEPGPEERQRASGFSELPSEPTNETSGSSYRHPAANIDFTALELMDALDLAVLIEQEAAERYEELAQMVGTCDAGDAADLFTWMARNEKLHGSQLAARRWRLFRDAPPRIRLEMIFDVEAPGYRRVHAYMTPREAMTVSIESERKAYEFYTEALAVVEDADVRELFRQLRGEEREHCHLLAGRLDEYPIEPEIEEGLIDDPPAL